MRNLHFSLLQMGISNISVSTTFSFINTISTTLPPSSADFQEPINQLLVDPVLQFLSENNSSFLIDIYPYTVYKFRPEITLGFALFHEDSFNFREDTITASRYRNLFDVMLDGVITALAMSGHENVKVIVTQTGWPADSSGDDNKEATPAYAEMYLKGLISHLKSRLGTPLKKDWVAEVYIYELFDDDDKEMMNEENNDSFLMNSTGNGRSGWGIMNPNMTMKYNLDFSGSQKASGLIYDDAWLVEFVLWIISQFVFWLL
ncbi:hypothetical protein ACH5RR_019321 [Cinchona calisaya]|uniref:Glucan endo-1,3-beta-D-glucosidase n=1 Tax=Cinchona calisaya TaxID=153742 RepID=A0ABD2ZP12_9GENT